MISFTDLIKYLFDDQAEAYGLTKSGALNNYKYSLPSHFRAFNM